MKKILLNSVLAIALLFAPFLGQAQEFQEEAILVFDSQIQVFQDGHLNVTETIKVLSLGQEINHGIYRDFPTVYRDQYGQRHLVGFDVLSVKRNGAAEPYHIERAGNGERVYIGSADVSVPTGQHEYQITYTTTNQIAFTPDHDELYWNVTGNGWVFPINAVRARVDLPSGIAQNQITANLYTGPQGSTEQNGTWRIIKQGAEFETTSPLQAYEGLTFSVTWPKGFVTAPTKTQKFWAQVSANRDYIIAVTGWVLVFVYFIYMWRRFGKDPSRGAIVAQYEPPQDMSPAMLRYIRRMGIDNRGFAAAMISMAAKGYLTITETKGFLGKKHYTLSKQTNWQQAQLSEEEKVLANEIFTLGEFVELKKENAKTIAQTNREFAAQLKKSAGAKYFKKNIGTFLLGLLISVGFVIWSIISASMVRPGLSTPLEYVFWPVVILLYLITNIVFAKLLAAYTVEGQKLADEIDGFKLFLSVTEKDRLEFHNPPEKTPELFEKYLPYALALDVEHQWSKQFASVFASLGEQQHSYIPAWYVGSSLANFNPDSFASDLGSSFAGVVASASVPPGSGSGGGGFSGGGGGGGGGGGW